MVKWYHKLKKEIVGIPLSTEPPSWECSSQTPEWQLADLGRRSENFVNDFKDYEIDENLSNLISGKRIAFIGPSPHLLGQHLGEFIDSHDLVIRINTSYQIPEELHADYGKRTDILVSCLNFNKIRSLQDNMSFTTSVKYIIQPQLSMWDIDRAEKIIHSWGVPYHNVSDGYLFKINKEVGTTCNTGLLGAITLLNYDIKELFMAGFTFFNMGKNNGYAYNSAHLAQTSKYDPVTIIDNKPTSESLRFDLHAQGPQIFYFGKIMQKYYGKIIKTDDYLINNFNLWIDGTFDNLCDKKIKNLLKIDEYLKEKHNSTITKWNGEI
jgi:hypothetical protein